MGCCVGKEMKQKDVRYKEEAFEYYLKALSPRGVVLTDAYFSNLPPC